jgi:hypothetical protein
MLFLLKFATKKKKSVSIVIYLRISTAFGFPLSSLLIANECVCVCLTTIISALTASSKINIYRHEMISIPSHFMAYLIASSYLLLPALLFKF